MIKQLFPSDPAERKKIPVGSGVLDYFTSALIEVAKVSQAGNDQHNPGESLHWTRNNSTDHSDTIIRHWMERGTIDTDGMRHSAKMAWRALALLQQELEDEGAPISRGSKGGAMGLPKNTNMSLGEFLGFKTDKPNTNHERLKERLKKMVNKRREIVPLEDGHAYYVPSITGYGLNATELRVLADILDERSLEWDKQLNMSLSKK